jgi:hypothetical protein
MNTREAGMFAFDWKLQSTIRRAKREVQKTVYPFYPSAKVLVKQGATRIDPRYISFWVATETDQQRNSLRTVPKLHEKLCGALLRAGYPADSTPLVHFLIESQETVDRDFDGSWPEAMEMP